MKKLYISFVAIFLSSLLNAQVSKEISIHAGGLQNILSVNEKNTITNLTIYGEINWRDFITIKHFMPMLSVLDLSMAKIADYRVSEIEYYPENEIPKEAFGGSTTLTSIILPSTCTSIKEGAFANCTNLTNITLPSTLTSIGQSAFVFCKELLSITLPSSLRSMGNSAFGFCSKLESVNIPPSITSIEMQLFAGCASLKSIIIPTSITTINHSAFWGCTSIKSLEIPSSVTYLGSSVVGGCSNLTSINIPSGFKYIPSSFFANCSSLTAIDIPPSVSYIGAVAFQNCTALTSINIPIICDTIGDWAFKGCKNLTTFIIPPSVKDIGEGAFYNCTGLKSIYAHPKTPVLLYTSSEPVFGNVDKENCILYVPIGTKSAYSTAYYWKDFKNIVEFSTTDIQNKHDVEINLYPNPVINDLRITGIEGLSTLKIYDSQGRLLLLKEIQSNEFISVRSFPKGQYFVKIINGKKSYDRKFIKE